jgi:tetratricopeptide (TPR) repeat protein
VIPGHIARVACVGVAILAAGCATMGRSTSSSTAGAQPRDSLEDYIGKLRHLSVKPPPARVPLPSIETENADLRGALEELRLGATPARHRRVAEMYRRAGVLDLAYDHYAAARHLDAADAAAYEGLARIWRDWGVPHLGLGDAKRAVYHAPAWATAYNTMGTLLEATGQREEARQAFERALALDPGAAYVWTNLCYQWFQMGDVSQALASCRRALVLEPEFVPAHHNLALVYAAAGDLDAARRQLQAARVDEPARLFNVGVVLSASRGYLEAAKSFDAAHALRPDWTYAGDRARQARRQAE